MTQHDNHTSPSHRRDIIHCVGARVLYCDACTVESHISVHRASVRCTYNPGEMDQGLDGNILASTVLVNSLFLKGWGQKQKDSKYGTWQDNSYLFVFTKRREGEEEGEQGCRYGCDGRGPK